MSDLYEVKVLEIDGAKVTLELLQTPSSDGAFPLAKGFAGMLLDPEGGPDSDGGKRRAALSALEDKATSEVVSVVEILEVRNNFSSPWEEWFEISDEAEDSDEDLDEDGWRKFAPFAIYQITVSNPAFIAHLEPGHQWGSTAYDELGEGGRYPQPERQTVRRFEFQEGSSSKFWEIERDGTDLIVRWGRIGTDGQEKTKTLDTVLKAINERDKLILEKTKKGYREVSVA